MTGSRAQWYNGILLLASFFSCRLLWGTYQSIRVYQDVWAGLHHEGLPLASLHSNSTVGLETPLPLGAGTGVMRFAHETHVPVWLASTYLGSNVVLNSLNFYWFGKMIETVKKRFRVPADRKGGAAPASSHTAVVIVEGTEMDGGDDDSDSPSTSTAAVAVGPAGAGVAEEERGSFTIDKRGVQVLEVHKTELRRRN